MVPGSAGGIPVHTRRLVEKLLQGYCERICPPQARHAVLLGFELGFDRAVVNELRTICGVPGTRRPVPTARFRYLPARQAWRLEYTDEKLRWRPYRPLPEAASFIELLRELDRDPTGVFWGHVDGKSLRWCSSRGRCAECDEKYCGVLGLATTPATGAEILPYRRTGSDRERG